MIKVELLDPLTERERTEAVWTDLHRRSDAATTVFMSWEWAGSWLDVYGQEYDPLVLAVFDGDVAIGLAPFFVDHGGGGRQLRRLHLVGQRPTYGEYMDLLVVPERRDAACEAIADALVTTHRGRWDAMLFERLLGGSALERMAESLESRGARTRTVEAALSPYRSLPASADELTVQFSKNLRKQLNQSRNRVAREGQVELALAGRDVDLDSAFEQMVELHGMRWGADQNSFSDPKRNRFHRLLAQRLLDGGHLFLALLNVDGRAIAARYDFAYGGKVWCVQGGWDSALEAARPAMHLTHLTLEWAIEQGFGEYDFLAGEHDYKMRWADGSRPLYTLAAANPKTWRGRIYRWRRFGAEGS